MAVLAKPLTLTGSRGSREVMALFDSGATYSCLHPDLARHLATVEPLPSPIDLATAREGEVLRATERVTLDFFLQGYRFSDEFLLVPGLSEPAIIGALTLQKWRLKLDFEAEEVLVDPRVTRMRAP